MMNDKGRILQLVDYQWIVKIVNIVYHGLDFVIN
jgi:hypothetical protein